MARDAAAAILAAAAEQAHPDLARLHGLDPPDLHDRCLWTVCELLATPHGARTARAAWSLVPVAQRHGHLVPPAGRPVFFQTNNAAWHVTMSDAEPWWLWSTDILRSGKLDRVPKSLIQRRWGARYLGWTSSLNGFVFPTGN